jgi:hypothetical protein
VALDRLKQREALVVVRRQQRRDPEGEPKAKLGPAPGKRLKRDELVDDSILALSDAARVDRLEPPYGKPDVARDIRRSSEGDNAS